MKGKNNKKGFTLVELLAALVILGLLTAIAAPNIIGILQSTKLNTYVQDAEKLVTLAEYKFKGDTSVVKPAAKDSNPNSGTSKCIIMTMKYLGTGEFKNPPYGGSYESVGDRSFVVIKRNDNSADGTLNYEYYVQLVEEKSPSNYSGVELEKYYTVKNNPPIDFIETGLTFAQQITAASPTTIDLGGGETCIVQARYVD